MPTNCAAYYYNSAIPAVDTKAWIAQSHLSSYIRQKERKTVKDQSLCLSKVNNKKENEREIGLPRSLSLSHFCRPYYLLDAKVRGAKVIYDFVLPVDVKSPLPNQGFSRS